MIDDKANALQLIPVSRETEMKLDALVGLLVKWQNVKNLVSIHSIFRIWTRHIADSLQLSLLQPNARNWLDLGSGGGFPGLVLAIQMAEKSNSHVILVESNARKCAFLREAARVLDLHVTIKHNRIEDVIDQYVGKVDVVGARALAPLSQLIDWTHKLLMAGTIGLFPKGQDLQVELTETSKHWTMEAVIHGSLTDPMGQILQVTGLTAKTSCSSEA